MALNCTYVRNSGTISAYADNGSDGTRVTASNHTLANGDKVRIRLSSFYNGIFTVSSVTQNSFDIARPFVQDDGASFWDETVESSVTMRLFRVSCPKINQLCSAQSEAWVAASTVCAQRLF